MRYALVKDSFNFGTINLETNIGKICGLNLNEAKNNFHHLLN